MESAYSRKRRPMTEVTREELGHEQRDDKEKISHGENPETLTFESLFPQSFKCCQCHLWGLKSKKLE